MNADIICCIWKQHLYFVNVYKDLIWIPIWYTWLLLHTRSLYTQVCENSRIRFLPTVPWCRQFNHFYLIVILFVSICYWDHKLLTKKSDLLGPFHIKNEMIISKARHTSNSSCSIFPSVEVDKGKSLQSIGKARGMRINIIYHTKKFKEFIFKSSVLVHQLQISWQTLDWPVFLSFAK